MPTYDYFCAANERVVEVQHSMQIKLTSWGELSRMAGIDAGDTPADTPVERLANGGQVVKSNSLKNSVPPCQVGGGCGGCG
ncbi:zinc ribbon domain-containing protein [Pseudomaricurvus sp. HS19]|uniref:zinc ribbon domain-containing protein n=1 Tax=Pseudomaricurvus sp. HS19 TaxID=2692626 RepID=UPI00136B7D6B|nr:zinc ribbon domain-containing protein [Pseudomaricurvus sp. HS19]MYM64411.1 zinc ribbon domain-containing protein [Pseudomaricurvus sp. HS19]